MQTSESDSDEKILQEVPMACDLLGLRRITPRKLSWQDTIYIGRGSSIPVPVDYVFVGGKKMILAKRMQGVLTTDEWKPLIGSTLLVRAWARPRAIKTLIIGIIVALVYYIPLLVLVLETPIEGPLRLVLSNPLIAVFVGLIGFILSGRIYSPEAHREMLRADLQIAGLVGQETFVAVLRKIDGMGFEEVRKLDRKGSMYKQPSVQERIQNLQTGGTVSLMEKPA